MDSAPGFGPGGCGFKIGFEEVSKAMKIPPDPHLNSIGDNMPGMILFKEKQAKILLSLKNAQQPWHIAGLATACGGTYVHTHNFIKGCAALGIVSVEKHGKSKEIKLTEKGTQLVDILSVVYSMINPSPQVPVKSEEKKEEKKDEKKEEKKEEKK